MVNINVKPLMAFSALMLTLCMFSSGCVDGAETSCTEGMVLCGGECVNIQNDARHCGGCNNACNMGSRCINSSCTTSCTPVQEECNGLDDDCDGQIDENMTRDCRNPCGTGVETCTDGSWGECKAPSPSTEVCDGVDNDCDGLVDEDVKTTFYRDSDSDSFGDPNNMTEACTAPPGYISDNRDCDDNNTNARPENPELCTNDFDDNCDGTINEGCACTAGATQNCGEGGEVGICEYGTQICQSDGTWGLCMGGVRPRAETCDGEDENCDGHVDNSLPVDFYEANNTCDLARPLPRADEGAGQLTVDNATLYLTDGSEDTDWYTIETNEIPHLECIPRPLESQCYFYLDISLTPPDGADHANWSFCVHTGDCGSFYFDACTDDTYWISGAYRMTLYASGVCGLDDSLVFYVEVDGAAGEENCRPYTLQYEYYFEGGIGDDYCM